MTSSVSESLEIAELEAAAVDRVAGRLRYVIDHGLPAMTWAAVVRSRHAAGRLRGIDGGAAERQPGVLGVVCGADVEAAGLAAARFGNQLDQVILAVDRVTHIGEPVAVVIAETAAAARSAAALVDVAIEPTAAVFDAAAALAIGAPLVRPGTTSNELSRWTAKHGDLEAAQAQTVRRFADEFSSPAAQQASLEPHVCLAAWTDGRLDVWTTSQNPSRTAEDLARIFGLDADGVRLRVPALGGGYGGKNGAKLEPLVAFVARKIGRPVKLVNPRADEFVTVTKHPATVRIESGVDAEGRFTYRIATILWNAGAYALSSLAVGRAGGLAVLGPYRIPAASVESVMASTNLPPGGSFRGLGVSQATWAGEQQVDRIAIALGEDPAELRRRNLLRSEDRLWTGESVGDAHWIACLDRARADIAARRPEGWPASEAPGGPAGEPSGSRLRSGTGMAISMKHTMTPARSDALVALRPDGRVEVRTSAVDMGQGIDVVLARAAAETLRIPLDRIVVLRPDTARTPFDATTSSSRATFAVGAAVRGAAADLAEQILTRAAARLGVAASDLDWRSGSNGDPSVAFAVALAAIGPEGPDGEVVGRASFVNEARHDPDTGRPVSSSHWHQGAVVVDVLVDPETGIVRLERAAGAAWAGRVMNEAGAELQNEGNLIFGLGPALFESLVFPDGRPSVTDLLDYRLPSIGDIPIEIATASLEDPVETTEVHGLGESLIPAVAPAVANAVAAAIGGRIRTMPISPERVLAAIDEAADDR
jgi:CO/xanthine dehydrogenase Mo-binding subunit